MSTKSIRILLTLLVAVTVMPDSIIVAKKMYYLSSLVTFDPEYIQDYHLLINPRNTSLNLILNIRKAYDPDVRVGCILSMKEGNANKFRTFLDVNVNVCELLGRGKGKLLTGLVQTFLKYGNLPKCCPIRPGNYSWHNLTFENIPPIFPSAKYEIVVPVYSKNKSIVHTAVQFDWK